MGQGQGRDGSVRTAPCAVELRSVACERGSGSTYEGTVANNGWAALLADEESVRSGSWSAAGGAGVGIGDPRAGAGMGGRMSEAASENATSLRGRAVSTGEVLGCVTQVLLRVGRAVGAAAPSRGCLPGRSSIRAKLSTFLQSEHSQSPVWARTRTSSPRQPKWKALGQ